MKRKAIAFIALALGASTAWAQTHDQQQLTREIYKELVEIRTVHPDGDNTAAARAMARRLLDAGFDAADVQVLEPAPLKGNLVARYRGTSKQAPLLLLAHIDVVEAKREDWSDGLDPFKLTEKDGFFYGRGVVDDKAMAASFVAAFIRYKREGYKPRRDLILALTADEEGGTHNGVHWLLANHRALIDAEFALNEGGGGEMRGGKPFAQHVQVSEKMYLSFDFEATNPGGHSSQPRKDNAIYDLAGALERLSRLQLPVHLSDVTRAFFSSVSAEETGARAKSLAAIAEGRADEEDYRLASANAYYNAQLRTTCVATRLEGGHADNALPQRARATVNCRLMPGEDPAAVLRALQGAAGERVSVQARGNPRVSEPSDARAPAVAAIRRVSQAMWPGVPVLPVMGSGATDGSQLRNAGIPTYGVSGLFIEQGDLREHGRDERVPVKSLFDSAEFLYRLVKLLGSGE
jgi:acetylornithine deacetylase/succinyl-diaminopimelate desuccinylase-like protein